MTVIPLLYNDFIKIYDDDIYIFNKLFNNEKKIRKFHIAERIYYIYKINCVLNYKYKENCNIYNDFDYDIYFPYFIDEDLEFYGVFIEHYKSPVDINNELYTLIKNDLNVKHFNDNLFMITYYILSKFMKELKN